MRAKADDLTLNIPYYPEYATMLGSVRAAIFLQYVKVLWMENGLRPFYKFSAPCSHDLYQKGMSWQEELWFTRAEVDSARSIVATKLTTKGKVGKQDVLKVSEATFSQNGVMTNAKSLAYYWTDAGRISWYALNLPLLKDAARIVGADDFKEIDVQALVNVPRSSYEREHYATPGYIYIAYAPTGHHKIGLSKNPGARIKQLNNTPYEVTIIHTFPANHARIAEEVLHTEFSSKRVRGEWFALSQEDVTWLCSITEYQDGRFIVQ